MKTETNGKKIILLTILLLSGIVSSYSQKLNWSARVSYESFTLESTKNYFKSRDYHNGFGAGVFISFDDKKTLLNYYAGIDFNRFHTEYYKMNFVGLPVGIDLVVGDRYGFFLGGCLKMRYQVNNLTPRYNEEFNSFILSYMIRSGLFAKYDGFVFRVYPKLEITQDPIITNVPFGQMSFTSLYLTTFSLNLEIQF